MVINPISVCFIVNPSAFVNVPVSVPELAITIRLVVLPLSLIASTIWPNLGTRSFFQTIIKIAFVNRSIFKFKAFNKGKPIFNCFEF